MKKKLTGMTISRRNYITRTKWQEIQKETKEQPYRYKQTHEGRKEGRRKDGKKTRITKMVYYSHSNNKKTLQNGTYYVTCPKELSTVLYKTEPK